MKAMQSGMQPCGWGITTSFFVRFYRELEPDVVETIKIRCSQMIQAHEELAMEDLSQQ